MIYKKYKYIMKLYNRTYIISGYFQGEEDYESIINNKIIYNIRI